MILYYAPGFCGYSGFCLIYEDVKLGAWDEKEHEFVCLGLDHLTWHDLFYSYTFVCKFYDLIFYS